MTALHYISIESQMTSNSDMEIVGLVMEVNIPGHTAHKTPRFVIYTCRIMSRSWCNRRNSDVLLQYMS